jgi:sigma-B regulation protein RsbU (phosphoserine phosphatase)
LAAVIQRRRTTIALLFDGLASEYAVLLRRAVERAATQCDVRVLVFRGQPLGAPAAASSAQNHIYGLINADSVDGVIVCSATLGHYCGIDGLVRFCQAYAPLPVCSLGVELPGIPSVIVDNEAGMKLGVEHLIAAHGAERIAFIAGPQANVESNLRLAGYHAALRDHGLPVDPTLIAHGNFLIPDGRAKMRDLLASGVKFDALVAANDDMALGALDVLREAGRQVPRDVLVCGFDDINSAHFALPSLSTLRQPVWWLGERAVASILDQLRGKSVPLSSAGQVEFVRRDSCGCGYHVRAPLRAKGVERPAPLHDVVLRRRTEICASMRAAASLPLDALGDWPSELLDSLEREVAGAEGHFGLVLEGVLQRAQHEGARLDGFQRVVSVLRAELRPEAPEDGELERTLERLWHAARVLVGAASIRVVGREKLGEQQASHLLAWVGERFATTLSLPSLREELVKGLPQLGIERGAIALYTSQRSRELKLLAACADGEELAIATEQFPDTELAPSAIFETEASKHFVVLPITFETEILGLAVLEGTANASIYEAVRQQIGSAVKSAMLHREVVAQVTLRSQLEAERMDKEARIAAAIQTSMNPVVLAVPGLEIAASMVPAAEAGGDYYDVIPTQKGAWIGIGDVTGHGLGSGLIMLMIQSMVAALSRLEPPPLPSEVVSAVGESIWDNVRLRLKRDDHATLTVFRYHGGGRFTFAGAHEELIVWRSRSKRCERVPTPGFWVGAVPSVRRMTQDSELVLDKGDVLVLYSDGVTEARNARQEQFSLERLEQRVEDLASKPVSAIRADLQEAVTSWSASLDDDVTLLIIRYLGD